MSFISLKAYKVRNLKTLSLQFNEKLNFLFGENGSGKTSFLESLYLLSTARSFRTRKINNLINVNSDSGESVVVYGLIKNKLDQTITVGVRKSSDLGTEIKVNNKNESSASRLAQQIAVLLIEPDSFSILNSSSKKRRQYLDWGVFHVEHTFANIWNDYSRCLKQRNSILRRTNSISANELLFWNKQLSNLSLDINMLRKRFFKQLEHELFIVLSDIYPELVDDLVCKFVAGWDQNKELFEVLGEQFDADRKRKYTQYGPHRCDIKLSIGKKSAYELLSRGQQKKLIIALYLAQVRAVRKLKGYNSVVLIDDITAELDEINTKKIVQYLLKLESQVFCTLLDDYRVNEIVDSSVNTYSMFHVEHGQITKIEN